MTIQPGHDNDLPEYSVWQFYSDKAGDGLAGKHERVRHRVRAEEAVKAARHYTDNVATKLGMVDRVIIVDGGDFTVFEWKLGEGVTYPPQDAEGRYVAGST